MSTISRVLNNHPVADAVPSSAPDARGIIMNDALQPETVMNDGQES